MKIDLDQIIWDGLMDQSIDSYLSSFHTETDRL